MIQLFDFMNVHPGWTFLFLLMICSLIGSIVKSITRVFVKHDCCDHLVPSSNDEDDDYEGDNEED